MPHPGTNKPPNPPNNDSLGPPEAWLPELLRVLDRQTHLYQRLDALGSEQSTHIKNSATDKLLSTLAKRQAVIDDITALNQHAEPFANDWPTLLDALPAEQRPGLRQRIDRLENLISRIAERDEADRATLEARRKEISADLSSMSNQRSAMNAYAGAAPNTNPTPRYQNRQG